MKCRTVVGLALIANLALLACGPGRAGASDPGDIVPFFKSADLEGRTVSLGDLVAAKRVAVLFWDWRRATSNRAMQALDRIQQQQASRGFAVLAVEGEGAGAEQVLDRVEKLRAIGVPQRYTILPDPGGRIARQFGVESTPQIFLLDGAGRVTRHFEDFRAGDEAALEEGVRELLGIQPPAAAPARTGGKPEPAAPAAPATVSLPPPEDPAQALFEKYRYFGNYHLNRGEAAKAEEYFRKLVALEPRNVEAWMRVGEACARQGRYDQAREAWESVQRVDPGNREADANIRRLIRGEY